jgi:hypothetical protein
VLAWEWLPVWVVGRMGAQRIAEKTWHMKMPTCKFCSSIFII